MNILKLRTQKTQKIATAGLLAFGSIFFIACSSDDDKVPEIINEEEVITTMKVTLTPENRGETIVFSYQDLDGDGSNEAVVQTENLAVNTRYDASILLLNETVEPMENITLEVEEEGEEHQFFYNNDAGMTTTYADMDANGNPIGVDFVLHTSGANSGSLTVVLRHEPNKNAEGVNEGNIENAGGETDILVTFDIVVQ